MERNAPLIDAVRIIEMTPPDITELHLVTNSIDAKRLLNDWAWVDAVTLVGLPLYSACCRGLLDVVETLLKYGADPNRPSAKIPLHEACRTGDVCILRALLNKGADPNILPIGSETESDETALYTVCRRGLLDLVEMLLNSGANPNLPSSKIPLYAACRTGDVRIVKALLNKGAHPNLFPSGPASFNDETALYSVCRRGSLELVETLLNYGADPTRPSTKIPLYAACQTGDVRIVRALLNNKADPNLLPYSLKSDNEECSIFNVLDDEAPVYGKRPLLASDDQSESAIYLSNAVGGDSGSCTSVLCVMCTEGNLPLIYVLWKMVPTLTSSVSVEKRHFIVLWIFL